MTLLVYGGKEAANAIKDCSFLCTAKGARNLLLHFQQATVAPGLIIGEGDGEVIELSQYPIGSLKQVLACALFGPSLSLEDNSRWERLFGVASSRNFIGAPNPFIASKKGNLAMALRTPLFGRSMQIQQPSVHVLRPRLVRVLPQRLTVLQEMSGTDAMSTCIGIVTTPAIMHPSASKMGPDLNLHPMQERGLREIASADLGHRSTKVCCSCG